jgi:hypothetical protein
MEVGDVLTVSDDTYTAQIIVTLSNYGRSPAVAASCFIELCTSVNSASRRQRSMIQAASQTIAMTASGRTLFPNFHREDKYEITAIRPERIVDEIDLGLFVVFCSYYGSPFRYASGIREIMRMDRGNIVFTANGSTIHPDQLSLTLFGEEIS